MEIPPPAERQHKQPNKQPNNTHTQTHTHTFPDFQQMNTMAEDCFLVEGVDEREVEGFGKEKKTHNGSRFVGVCLYLFKECVSWCVTRR